MDILLLLAVVATFVVAFYGLFLLVFRRGKRRRGGIVLICSFVALITIGNIIANLQIEREGWSSHSEKAAAAEAGVADPAVWTKLQAAERERSAAEATRKAQAEAAAAERAAVEAAAEAERAAAEKAAEELRLAEEKAEEEARDKRHGFHCLSPWDGSHRGLVRMVKDLLNDPDSFKHAETVTWPVRPDGRNQVVMQYRAKTRMVSALSFWLRPLARSTTKPAMPRSKA